MTPLNSSNQLLFLLLHSHYLSFLMPRHVFTFLSGKFWSFCNFTCHSDDFESWGFVNFWWIYRMHLRQVENLGFLRGGVLLWFIPLLWVVYLFTLYMLVILDGNGGELGLYKMRLMSSRRKLNLSLWLLRAPLLKTPSHPLLKLKFSNSLRSLLFWISIILFFIPFKNVFGGSRGVLVVHPNPLAKYYTVYIR